MSKCTTLKYGGVKANSCVSNLLNYWKTCQAFSSLLQTTNISLYAEYMAIKKNPQRIKRVKTVKMLLLISRKQILIYFHPTVTNNVMDSIG